MTPQVIIIVIMISLTLISIIIVVIMISVTITIMTTKVMVIVIRIAVARFESLPNALQRTHNVRPYITSLRGVLCSTSARETFVLEYGDHSLQHWWVRSFAATNSHPSRGSAVGPSETMPFESFARSLDVLGATAGPFCFVAPQNPRESASPVL